MRQRQEKFQIGSYVIVTNDELKSYGLTGQVIDPNELDICCGKKSICVRFEKWFDGNEKILKIMKKNVKKIMGGGGNIMGDGRIMGNIKSDMLAGICEVAVCSLNDYFSEYNFAAFKEDNIKPGDRVMVDDLIHGEIIGKVKYMSHVLDEPIRGEII